MAKKILAINVDGDLTYCAALEENRGKGRCNHPVHSPSGVETAEFLETIHDSKDLGTLVNASSPDSDVEMGGSTPKFYNPTSDSFIKLDLVQEEALREEFSSRIAVAMSLTDAVQYDSSRFKDVDGTYKIGVESENFKYPGERERPLSYFYQEDFVESEEDWDSDEEYFIENLDWKELKRQIETIKSVTDTDMSSDVLKLSAFDIIIGNSDRISNLGNIGVIEKADGTYRSIPPFDFGMAFPPQDEQDFMSDEALKDKALSFREFARDHYGARSPILKVNYDKLKSIVNSYSNPLYDKEKVSHVKAVFIKNLKMTEGILWQKELKS